jgi:hypothetical protein
MLDGQDGFYFSNILALRIGSFGSWITYLPYGLEK